MFEEDVGQSAVADGDLCVFAKQPHTLSHINMFKKSVLLFTPVAKPVLLCTANSIPKHSAKVRRRRALWLVGFPRRKSSLSIDGRSSWMSDMVCSISIAHAAGMAVARSPPTASHAARHRHGRTRLPPASSEYLAHSVELDAGGSGANRES